MAVKKQPDSGTSELPESAHDWFRQFLKHLELFMVETSQSLGPDSNSADHRLVAMRAVKLTFLESGMNHEEVRDLFGLVAIESVGTSQSPRWNREFNRRRFELIDGDIQGTLNAAEQIELAGLTQLMREQVDSEANLPFEGARQLHRRLADLDSGSADSQ